jgi:hypothetical protein
MSTAPQRTRTPKDEKAREAALDESFTIRIDDEVYTIDPADITGLLEMKVRRETGMSVTEIISKMQSAPGIDLIGCFMYACEVAAGREADLEKILGSVSMDSDFEVVDGDGEVVELPQR